MTLPQFACEIAPGALPGDDTYAWQDATPYLRSFTTRRGRQYELNQMSAGTATVTLLNLDRRFDPSNAGGAYYPDLKPMMPIRLTATFAGTTYPIFTGYVTRYPQQRQGPTYAEVQLASSDGFALLANAQLPAATYPEELTGARVTRILDAAGWSAGRRSTGTGASTISSYTFADSDGVVALNHLLDVVETTEVGIVFVSAGGDIVFLDRHSSYISASVATLTDTPSLGLDDLLLEAGGAILLETGAMLLLEDGLEVADAVASLDVDLVYNSWTGTRDGGTPQKAFDSASVSAYGLRSQTVTPLLTADSLVLRLMQFQNGRYKDPVGRIEQVTLIPGDEDAAWLQALTRELGDRVTVMLHPVGGGDATVTEQFVEQIAWDSGDEDPAQAKVTWSLAPAPMYAVWVAGQSRAGVDTRAAY